MICPRCNEGTLTKIKFKRTGRLAFLCDVCGSLWFEGENIKFNTAHTLESYSQSEGREYTIDELAQKDQEHQPARRNGN